MSAATRHPAGMTETGAASAIFIKMGIYVQSLILGSGIDSAEQLAEVALIAVPVALGAAMTWFYNRRGGPLAGKFIGPMKGAQLGAILIALWLPLGCAMAITGDGAFLNVGQSTVSTCGDVADGSPTATDCTVVDGGPISPQFSNVLGGVLQGALRMLGLSYGVPAAPGL